MNNGITFKTDTTEVQQMLDYFKNNDWVNAEKTALRKAANRLKRQIKNRFKSMLPKANHRSEKFGDRLIDAVRSSKVRSKNNSLVIKVHTLGKKDEGGTYRARMFNNSTQTERHTKAFVDKLGRNYKNGRSTGVLKQVHYFDDSGDEYITSEEINQYIKDAIEKVNQRKIRKLSR